MATFDFLRWQPPPYPPSLTAYLNPPEGGTPNFVHKNDSKGCSLDYLDALGHFLFGFGATRKSYRGGGGGWLQLLRRGLTHSICLFPTIHKTLSTAEITFKTFFFSVLLYRNLSF